MTQTSLISFSRPVSFCAHLEFLVVHSCLLLACLAAPSAAADLCVLPPCRNVAVSSLLPVSVDTVAVGLVSSVVVYPLYLLILFLFRMARGRVRRGDGCRLLRWVGGTRFAFGRLNSAFPGTSLLQMGSALARLCCSRARPFPGLCPLPELGSLLASARF